MEMGRRPYIEADRQTKLWTDRETVQEDKEKLRETVREAEKGTDRERIHQDRQTERLFPQQTNSSLYRHTEC